MKEIESLYKIGNMSLDDCKNLGKLGFDEIKIYKWLAIKKFEEQILYLGINTFERPWEHSRASGTHTIYTAEIVFSREYGWNHVDLASNGFNISLQNVAKGCDLISTDSRCAFLVGCGYGRVQIIEPIKQ